MKRKILLVYAALNNDLRPTTRDLIECFRRYSDDHWFYLNLAHAGAPAAVSGVAFDLVVFQTTFTQRLSRSAAHYERMSERAARLKQISAPKVAFVQDEFWNVAKVERFISAFDVRAVFSVAPESEWPKLYPAIDRERVRFHRVLTGYLDDDSIERIAAFGGDGSGRPLDIVYRAAGDPDPAWGRLGHLKQTLAETVLRLAPQYGLRTDISTNRADAKLGDEWYRFLASSRYAIGVESGASLLDRDGEIHARVAAYRNANPAAGFEEIEAHCFPGMDGKVAITALGPRHLEACATRTCQVLTEGEYNGLLKPEIHYIPLARDLLHVGDVLATLSDEERRRRMVQRAYDDIVRSGKITYRHFVREILDVSFSLAGARPTPPMSAAEGRIQARMKHIDAAQWAVARHLSKPVRRLRDALDRLTRRAN